MPKSTHVPVTMDQLITIQRGTVTRDANGGEILTWADWKTRWARITYGGGGEAQSSGKETAVMSVTFQMRWVDGLTEKDRISHKGYYYDILAIIPNGRQSFYTIESEFRR